MGIWNGYTCVNACADAVTSNMMHVDVPSMWHYVLPQVMFDAFQANRVSDRYAYQCIARATTAVPMADGCKQRFLAFLGLDD